MSKGIGECERRAEAVRSMGGEDGGEGPKVTRGLRAMEVVIGRGDETARKEPGPRGVAEEGCDGTGKRFDRAAREGEGHFGGPE